MCLVKPSEGRLTSDFLFVKIFIKIMKFLMNTVYCQRLKLIISYPGLGFIRCLSGAVV